MKKIFSLLAAGLFFSACSNDMTLKPGEPVYVTITSTMGDVTVKLYDDTPLHRDNFIKLCQENAYDGVLFHRIIKDFVVQGGDPASKAHEPGVLYGDGDGGYTIPAEILPNHFNKRGALIDAKEGDDVNPQRASAGTQFCYVQGKRWTDAGLDSMEVRINQIRENWLKSIFRMRLVEQQPELKDKPEELEAATLKMTEDTLSLLQPVVIPPEHREVYKNWGGTPHLDGSVSIWGEVVEGLDIVEKMSLVSTDENDRPLEDVIILKTKVFNK